MTVSNAFSPLYLRSPQFANASAGQARQEGFATLSNRLSEKLGLPADALKTGAENFTPEKVAERVLSFVEQRLSQEAALGADPKRLESVMNQARQGVEQGFKEARQILDGMGLLKSEVASNIDDTYGRIQQGFSDLETRYLPKSSTPTQLSAASSQRFNALAQSFELQVTTRDGDKLRISIAQASANWSSASAAVFEQGGLSVSAASAQSGSLQVGAWQVSVEGELDEAELQALDKLFAQVQEISNDFYSGNLTGAFDRALALNLDGEQLSSMALNLSQTSVRQVSESYGSISGPGASAINADLQDYVQSLLDALRSTERLLQEPVPVLEQLLNGALALDERFEPVQLEKAQGLNHSLLEGLMAYLPGAKEPV